jgi:hypothetical protein
MFMMNFIGRLWKKDAKWHEVEWRDDGRTIWMALRFAPEAQGESTADNPAPPVKPPYIESLPGDGASTESTVEDAAIIEQVQTAVAEYNKMNLCALRVVGIRRHAVPHAQAVDYGTATRKLLNLL